MCIACELGYWMMIDALEAERAAKGSLARTGGSDFACDAPAEPVQHASETGDERTP
jgi:hypothetical protein